MSGKVDGLLDVVRLRRVQDWRLRCRLLVGRQVSSFEAEEAKVQHTCCA